MTPTLVDVESRRISSSIQRYRKITKKLFETEKDTTYYIRTERYKCKESESGEEFTKKATNFIKTAKNERKFKNYKRAINQEK